MRDSVGRLIEERWEFDANPLGLRVVVVRSAKIQMVTHSR